MLVFVKSKNKSSQNIILFLFSPGNSVLHKSDLVCCDKLKNKINYAFLSGKNYLF